LAAIAANKPRSVLKARFFLFFFLRANKGAIAPLPLATLLVLLQTSNIEVKEQSFICFLGANNSFI